jgi:hypothetical protein
LLFATNFSVVVYTDVLMKKEGMDVESIHHYVNEHFVVHRVTGRPE